MIHGSLFTLFVSIFNGGIGNDKTNYGQNKAREIKNSESGINIHTRFFLRSTRLNIAKITVTTIPNTTLATDGLSTVVVKKGRTIEAKNTSERLLKSSDSRSSCFSLSLGKENLVTALLYAKRTCLSIFNTDLEYFYLF